MKLGIFGDAYIDFARRGGLHMKFVNKKKESEVKAEKTSREKRTKHKKIGNNRGTKERAKITLHIGSPKQILKKLGERFKDKKGQEKTEFKRVEKVFFLRGIQFNYLRCSFLSESFYWYSEQLCRICI